MITFDNPLPEFRELFPSLPVIDREAPPADAMLLGSHFCKLSVGKLNKLDEQFKDYFYFRSGCLCVAAKYTYRCKVDGEWILAMDQDEFPIAAATFLSTPFAACACVPANPARHRASVSAIRSVVNGWS